MKKILLLIFISSMSINIIAQDKVSDVLTIDGLTNLMDLSKENADKWLTKDNNFAFFQENEKYNATIYTFDYNSELKIAPVWLYYFNKIEEIIILTKKNYSNKLIKLLESKKFLSNLNSDGTLITTYIIENKEFVVTINPSKEVIIRIIMSPADESESDKKTRHNNLIIKN